MPKPAKHNKAWSAQEIALLKEHYRKGTLHREIAKTLKRTINAIESKATELGLKSKRRKK